MSQNLLLPIAAAVLLLLAAAPVADAQGARVWRIGVMGGGSGSLGDSLEVGLRELGHVPGRDVVIDYRWAEGKPERFSTFAAELIGLNVDVIVADTDGAIQAAQKATSSIPIVMVLATDPVALGFVATLARPGRNITGLTLQTPDHAGKALQLLKELTPNMSRVAVLWDRTHPGHPRLVAEAESAAPTLGLQVQPFGARTLDELENVLAEMPRQKVDAVVVRGSPLLFVQRARIAAVMIKNRLPSICVAPVYVEAGCLMSYGASFTTLYRRAAYFVDKIMKGAKPSDLPVQQPTKFDFVINRRTAKALGRTLPPSLLVRADQVID